MLAYKDNYAIVVEVKGTDSVKNYNKAVKQLNRAEECCIYLKNKRVFKVYGYSNEKGGYNLEWIKKR